MPRRVSSNPNPDVQRYAKSRIFQDVIYKAFEKGLSKQNTVDSAKWFRDKAKQIGKDVTPEDLMSDSERLKTRFEFGNLYSFFYVPKHKDDPTVLPYYDIFPLIFPVQPAENGFYGINLHYLPPTLRAKLMDELFTLRNNDRFDKTTKLVLSYEILKQASRMSAFKPCFKHYLNKHVYSKFMEMKPIEWNIALFLPTERFIRATRDVVWADSRKAIRGK